MRASASFSPTIQRRGRSAVGAQRQAVVRREEPRVPSGGLEGVLLGPVADGMG